MTRGSRRRRVFNALAALGTAAHNGFERWAGVGVFLEPWLGRRNTNLLWSVLLPVWVWRALAGEPREEPALAFGAGSAIAGAVVHYIEWPWSPRLGFVPWLEEAEGFRASLLPAYNAILCAWFLAGIGSVLVETPRKRLPFTAAGLATGPLLLASARHHFAWARRQAEQGNPHFNTDLLESSPRRSAAAGRHAS
jgi:hypothetical protein